MTHDSGSSRWRPSLRRHVPGEAPGLLAGERSAGGAPGPDMQLLAWDEEGYEEHELGAPRGLLAHLERYRVSWLSVRGPASAERIAEIGQVLGLHPLALEDVLHTDQRPKVEDYGDVLFIVARVAGRADLPSLQQLSLFLGRRFVVTFEQSPVAAFERVRDRVRRGGPRIRRLGPDYLAYALLDAVVDGYFPVLEALGERLERLDDEILLRPTEQTLAQVYREKRELQHLRRTLWPLRDMLGVLLRQPSPLVSDEVRVYLRDCYDHALRCVDVLESDRELVTGLTDLYLSSVSHRSNEIMKVLTIMATIFIPLTFVAGLYGMNFDPDVSPWNMPELRWRYGYPAALAVMLVSALALLVYFYRKGWLRPSEPLEPEDLAELDRELGGDLS